MPSWRQKHSSLPWNAQLADFFVSFECLQLTCSQMCAQVQLNSRRFRSITIMWVIFEDVFLSRRGTISHSVVRVVTLCTTNTHLLCVVLYLHYLPALSWRLEAQPHSLECKDQLAFWGSPVFCQMNNHGHLANAALASREGYNFVTVLYDAPTGVWCRNAYPPFNQEFQTTWGYCACFSSAVLHQMRARHNIDNLGVSRVKVVVLLNVVHTPVTQPGYLDRAILRQST